MVSFVSREVVECEEFLTLTHQQVSKLISSDRLTVPTEEKVGNSFVLSTYRWSSFLTLGN